MGKHPVGWGGSSDVWKGRLASPFAQQTDGLVAVKVLRVFTDETGMGKVMIPLRLPSYLHNTAGALHHLDLTAGSQDLETVEA